MVKADRSLFDGWQVYHLTGHGADDAVRGVYARHGIAARVEAFLHDIGLAWDAADLAISRAGANSVGEAAANAVPTLFLPYPHHRDMHQANNARPLIELGGAVLVRDQIDAEANVEHIGPVLRRLMTDGAEREVMRGRLDEHRPADAAEQIARLLLTEPVGEAARGKSKGPA